MEMIRLKYVRGRSNAKLVFNRIRYFFNKENNFTVDVPVGAWNAIKDGYDFAPAPIEIEKKIEEPQTEAPVVPESTIDESICDVCGFKAKSKPGAMAHKRAKHKEA